MDNQPNQNNYNGIKQCASFIIGFVCFILLAIAECTVTVGRLTYNCMKDICILVNHHCCNYDNDQVENLNQAENINVVIAGNVEEGNG